MIIRSIDFETTGTPTETDPQAIVEVGWADLPATGYHSQLCNPGRPIPFEAMAVHHITESMVASAPAFHHGWIDGADIYVAHNADFERQFYKTDKPWICTWKVALRVFSDLPQHNLQFLRYALDLEFSADEPHRAGPDAMLAALLFERIQCEHDAPDIDTMIRWSNGHALYPRCPLHKHKGKPWSEVPSDYLEWIANKPNDVAADIKANARLELKKRAS